MEARLHMKEAENTVCQAAGTGKIEVRNLNFYYGKQQALFDNSITIHPKKVTAIIGPSGCGKSTHIRVYNRIYELYRDQHATGEVLFDGKNILSADEDLLKLRKRVGMIFQKPTPFPMSVLDNVAYGLKLHYKLSKHELAARVEQALHKAALWDEVKDKLNHPGMALSGGQQQRLCIARSIAVEPEILLIDEPTSAIDPVATSKIETYIAENPKDATIILQYLSVSRYLERIADLTTNIAEDPIYLVEGRIARHDKKILEV